jgi:hypothetical protein
MIAEYEIRFDIQKEPRQSTCDSRELICIDVDRVGANYRAIINGYEFELPEKVQTMAAAKQSAIYLAVKSINEAISELLREE